MGCDPCPCCSGPLTGYFNPRTPVGCDDMLFPAFFSCSLFQSTHPSGVRLGHLSGFGARQVISIHAPQWGATLTVLCHTPSSKAFQSTHPSGVRRPPSRRPASDVYFNPRTPVGCDTRVAESGASEDISIHAPQWGATGDRGATARDGNISIHAPQWGATGCRSIGMVRW